MARLPRVRRSPMTRLLVVIPIAFLILSSKVTGWFGVVVGLGGLIFVHELGHFMVAKWMKLPVEVFSLGFGPRLLGFKWRETDVRLSALPLGGYVKLLGFNPEEPDAEDPYGFMHQPLWKRQLFFAGGIIFNVLTAFIVLACIGVSQSRVTKSETRGVIMEVKPGYPAAEAGLKGGEEVVAVGDISIRSSSDWDKAVAFIQSHPDQPMHLDLNTNGRLHRIELVPKNENGVGRLGFQPALLENPIAWRPIELKDLGVGIRFATIATPLQAWRILVGYGRLLSGRESLKNVGGPGTIGKMAYQFAQRGLIEFLGFVAFLSLNLAVLNALPIPFLDGGHMAILAFEKVRGRDLSILVKERILMGGLILLGSLMIFVIVLDVIRFRQ